MIFSHVLYRLSYLGTLFGGRRARRAFKTWRTFKITQRAPRGQTNRCLASRDDWCTVPRGAGEGGPGSAAWRGMR